MTSGARWNAWSIIVYNFIILLYIDILYYAKLWVKKRTKMKWQRKTERKKFLLAARTNACSDQKKWKIYVKRKEKMKMVKAKWKLIFCCCCCCRTVVPSLSALDCFHENAIFYGLLTSAANTHNYTGKLPVMPCFWVRLEGETA